MTNTDRLGALGLDLPPVVAPAAAYVPAVRHDRLAYVSGQLPVRDGVLLERGAVGGSVDEDRAVELARICALNALAAAASVAGGLDGLARVLRLGVFVASAPGFVRQHVVADGASRLLAAVLGPDAAHARAAVGVAALPLDAPVEVEATFLLGAAA